MVTEIDEIDRMSKLFRFPESINYEKHKSLMVNGMEIFPWIYVATKFYKRHSFTTGQNLGIGAEIVLRNKEIYKSEDILKMYEFYIGFMSVDSQNFGVTN